MEQVTSVIGFWRDFVGPEHWFDSNSHLDQECRRRFGRLWLRARLGGCDAGEASPEGALALVILFDQLPRSMFRGTREAWLTDPRALEIAKRAVENGFDWQIQGPMRQFFYMPFLHAEELRCNERGLQLMEERVPDGLLHDARARLMVIRRFGRFPWRNDHVGRRSSDEEAAFLWAGGYDWALRAQHGKHAA